MSNNSFSGISNDELFNHVNASQIKADSVKGSLNCDSLFISGTYPIAAVSAARAFTQDEIFSMSKKGHLFITSTIGAPLVVNLGADTADRAKELLAMFDISDDTKRLVRITPTATSASHILSIGNSSAGGLNTSNNVQVSPFTLGATHSTHLLESQAKGEAYILVSKAGDNKILFHVICIGKA
jgi:hypothetical protein